MNILVLGSGGREHALAWKLSQSPNFELLYVAPGNAGTNLIAHNLPINISDFDAIANTILEKNISMLVVGPEQPLVDGIVDYFRVKVGFEDLLIIGPSQQGAELEGSKKRAKLFMKAHGIPTAKYESFTVESLNDGFRFLDQLKPPYVLKADGLAAGKGVLIINNLEEAKQELKAMLTESKFGNASNTVVIEEFLEGIELSVFVLTDGTNYTTLPNAKDYKRIGEGDTGLNTGGMGAISPVPFADEAFMSKVETRIIKPTIEGFKKEDIDYKGFVFIGLMKVGEDPYVIEYNVRMGDPETEVVIPRIKTDLVDLLQHTAKGSLNEINLKINPESAATIMLVSGGYPEAYQKGKTIKGIENINTDKTILFHAGTSNKEGTVVSNGGRVIAVTSLDSDYKKAIDKSYKEIKHISFEDMYFRTDIGFDL